MSKRKGTIGVVALAALAVTFLAAYLAGALPYRAYVVHTGSMGDTIPSRSAVIVHTGEYRIGQVVTFHVNDATETHRLLAIDQDGNITTKGDANRTADPWHPPKSNIVGGVVEAPRRIGWWIVFVFQTPTGGLSIALFIFALWQCFRLERPKTAPSSGSDPETESGRDPATEPAS